MTRFNVIQNYQKTSFKVTFPINRTFKRKHSPC